MGVLWRECKIMNCNGRCLTGRVFGRGFDSRQVHRKSLVSTGLFIFFRSLFFKRSDYKAPLAMSFAISATLLPRLNSKVIMPRLLK